MMEKTRRLLCIVGVLLVAAIVKPSSSQQCSAVPGLDSYAERKENASSAVLTNMQTIATTVIPELSQALDNTSVNSSKELYEAMTVALNVQNTSSFESFTDALEEITDAYFLACYGETDQKPTPENLIPTLRDLLALLDALTTDNAEETLPNIREYFGQITCLIDTYGYDNLLRMTTPSTNATEVGVGTRSRRSSPTDCYELQNITLRAFYDCIGAEDLEPIFGLGPIGRAEGRGRGESTRRCVGFVVDTTGSMADEIVEARKNIKKFIQSEKDLPACYVLVEFNDYGAESPSGNVGKAMVYDPLIANESDGSTLKRTGGLPVKGFLELFADVDALFPHGGGDCPEYGMTGILNALEAIDSVEGLVLPTRGKLHHIITLTDASAKDSNRTLEVVNAANEAKTTVHFFYSTSGCADGFNNYEQVRMGTGGIAVHNFADFDAFSKFIQLYSESLQTSNPPTGRKKRATDDDDLFSEPAGSHSVFVNHLIDSLAILAETAESNVTVTKPNGQQETVAVSGMLALYTDDNPVPGLWTISVASGTLQVIVSAPIVLGLDITYTTVDAGGELIPTQDIPHACDTGTILATAPQLSKISLDYPLYLNLLDLDGNILEKIELTHCRGILSGVLTYPNAPLVFYQLQGHDIGANPFRKTFVDQEVTFKPPKIPLKITFVKDSPIVTNNSVTVFIHTNQPVSNMQCEVSPINEVKNCTDGYVQFTGLPARQRFRLKVDATMEDGRTARIKQQFSLDQDGHCAVHLINEGVSVEGNKVMVKFTSTGDTTSTVCILNPPQTPENKFFSCTSPVLMYLEPGSHKFKVTPKGCSKSQRIPLKAEFEVKSPNDRPLCPK